MQERFHPLISHERRHGILCWLVRLKDEEVGAINLYYIAYILEIQTHLVMMTTLVERWHSKTSSFHILIKEATITLEDVWCILWVTINGDKVIYDVDLILEAMFQVLVFRVLELESYLIDLQRHHGRVSDSTLFIARLIMGVLVLIDAIKDSSLVGV